MNQNPATIIRDWLVAAGYPVDEKSFVEAAAYCDEPVGGITVIEFERQVKDALEYGYFDYVAWAKEKRFPLLSEEDWRAQRVAAAIEAVVQRHRSNVTAAEWPGQQAGDYGAALVALGVRAVRT